MLMWVFQLAVLLFLIVGSASSFAASSYDKEVLFNQIFGGKAALSAPQEITTPFSIDGRYRGNIVITKVESERGFCFQSAPFIAILRDVVKDDYIESLGVSEEDDEVCSADLKEHGVVCSFDKQKIVVTVETPVDKRRLQEHLLKSLYPPHKEIVFTLPAEVSSYLNIFGSGEYFHNSQQSIDTGFAPWRLSLLSTTRAKEFVFEAKASYSEERNPMWQVQGVRVMYDDIDKMTRYTVGDLFFPTVGFQGGRSIVGVGVAREFSLNPFFITEPVSQEEFLLKKPVDVEVWVNQNMVKSMKLPAGPHRFKDFPLQTGSNDVHLLFKDEFGREKSLDIPFIHDPNLLSPAVTQYSFVIGAPVDEDSEELLEYHWSNPMASGFYRTGITSRFSLAQYIQIDQQQLLSGTKGEYATPCGLINADVAVSAIYRDYAGWACQASFDNYIKPAIGEKRFAPWSWGASGSYTHRHFAQVGLLEPNNDNSYRLYAYAAKALPVRINLRFSASYDFARRGSLDRFNLSSSFGKRDKKGAGLNLNLTYRRNSDGQREGIATVILSWSPISSNYFITVNGKTRTSNGSFVWRYVSPNPQTKWSSSVEGNFATRQEFYRGNFSVENQYGKLSLSQLFGQNWTAEGERMSSTKFFVNTAIAYADGFFAISPTVRDSFAIIAPDKTTKGYQVSVNPVHGVATQKATANFPSTVNKLRPFFLNKVYVEIPDLPVGYNLEQTLFYLSPKNKSGFLIQPKKEVEVILTIVLVDAAGKPLPLQGGKITGQEQLEGVEYILFSNKDGRVIIRGLKPGKWHLRLFKDPALTADLTIPPGLFGIHDYGSIYVGE
ncbi:fimbrial biogenesis outer membrane usher protein [Simkania negevensis]|uniref:Fimbrial biogenesis outer membrane usher protein n=1 Tax=Simkania negevensis TaxID=83561 RepID=A0ABS3ARB9_9BACT|nr:fimbrial biogenesis outer membrane usher protein [Simkania negevensis]